MKWHAIFVQIAASCFITVLTFEAASLLCTKLGLLPFNDTPPVYGGAGLADGMAWRTEKEVWGAWHRANATDRHVRPCFDITYRSNSVGARDEEFNSRLAHLRQKIVLLGDSFAEGFGIAIDATIQARLEAELPVEVFNFGAGGDVGPVQYFLLYRDLASKFAHDAVVLLFLPANDFTDNDEEYPLFGREHRYRPYWRPDGNGGFSVVYPERAVPSDVFGDAAVPGRQFREFLRHYFFGYNVFRTARHIWASRNSGSGRSAALPENTTTPRLYSGYLDATSLQQEAALHFVKEIAEYAGDRLVYLVAIPIAADISRIRGEGGLGNQAWRAGFEKLAAARPRTRFIDLLEHVPDSGAGLYLPCDGHWSEYGHSWAASIVAKYLKIDLPI